MAYQSLGDAVLRGENLAESVQYVMDSGNPDELFDDRHGGRIGLLHFMFMAASRPGVEVMLDIGADPNLLSSDGNSPLSVAIIRGNLELARLLVERGASVMARCKRGETPLHMALIGGHTSIAELLLENGADPDAPDALGVSPRQIKQYQTLK